MGLEEYVLTQEQMTKLACVSEQAIGDSPYYLRFRNYYGNIFLATIAGEGKETLFSVLTTYSPQNKKLVYKQAKTYVDNLSSENY